MIDLGAGNDRLRLGSEAIDGDVFQGGGGTDTFDLSAFNWSTGTVRVDLAAGEWKRNGAAEKVTGFENIEGGGGTVGEVLIGSTADNTIKGNAGADIIVGGLGIDTLDGGADDDIFEFSPADIVVGETANGGTGFDTLRLIGSGSHRFDLIGLTLLESVDFFNFGASARSARFFASQLATGKLATNAAIDGNTQKDVADELRFDMGTATSLDLSALTFTNWEKTDLVVVVGDGNAENIRGSSQTTKVSTAGGDDRLLAGAGVDLFDGGANTDTISYENLLTAVDVSLSRAVTVSGVAYTGSGLGGDAQGDAYLGVENVVGSGRGDKLTGNAGSNVIDGGAGTDEMRGLAGDDTYHVNTNSDVIIEGQSEGANDTVLASATYDLLTNVHVEILKAVDPASKTSLNLYGNALKQHITGNAGNNLISDGGAGVADTLQGLAGDDTYRVYNAGDIIIEGISEGAADAVHAAVSYTLGAGVHVETLRPLDLAATTGLSLFGNELAQVITGDAGDNTLRGYGGDDTISGGNGADKISGGPGNDVIAGNVGADTYYFSYALNAATNVDTINGYSGIDLISLNASIFTKAGPVGALAASAFVANATGEATTAAHRITYETDTGMLRYDADGTGAGGSVAFAIMGGLPTMNAADFVIA